MSFYDTPYPRQVNHLLYTNPNSRINIPIQQPIAYPMNINFKYFFIIPPPIYATLGGFIASLMLSY